MKSFLPIAVLLAMVFSVGCGSLKSPGTPSGHLPASATEEEVLKPQPGSKFTVIERIPRDGSRRLPPNEAGAPVDYNSKLMVVPNPEEIVKQLHLDSSAKPLDDKEEQALSLLADLATSYRAYTRTVKSVSTAADVRAEAMPARVGSTPAYQDLAPVYERYWTAARAAGVPLSLPSPGAPAAAVAPALSTTAPAQDAARTHDAIKAGGDFFRRRFTAMRANATALGSLRIEASILPKNGKTANAIHVEPYDNIPLSLTPKNAILNLTPPTTQSSDNATRFNEAVTTAPAAPAAEEAVPAAPDVRAKEASLAPPTTDVSPIPTDFPLRTAPPGIIDLESTTADRGDRINIKASLVQPSPAPSGAADLTLRPATAAGPGAGADAGSGGDQPRTISEMTYDVERLDFSLKFTGNVIFVNEFGRPEMPKKTASGKTILVPGDHSHTFSPSASAALSLHYRPRVDSESNRGSDSFWRTWNAIDPAIGVNIAALNLTGGNSDNGNGSLQVGIGIQLSFVDDLFQIGYGYDLNAQHRPQYWFVGISVFDAINAAGNLKLNPLGGK